MKRAYVALAALAVLVLAPASGARAATRATYVGIVISGHGTGCVKWHSGITGDEILNDVAGVHYRHDGIIDQIDGQPSPPHADDTHYWSYWHDSGGTWTYSGSGAGGASPAAGTVDGWVFGDGSAGPTRSPSGLYAALCGGRDPRPAPASSSHHSAPRPASNPPVAAHGSSPARTVRPSATRPGTANATSGATASSAPHGPARTTGEPRVRSTAGGTTYATGPDAPTFVAAKPASASTKRPPSGSVLPVILGGALAVLLAGGAGWTVLRRRRASGDY